MKKGMIVLGLALIISSITYADGNQQDTIKKPPPFVKELPKDTAKFKTPVLERIDTMKNNMPVVDPKKKNVQPK